MTRLSGGCLLSIAVDKGSSVPLTRQIYAEIRNGILDGRLKPGLGLPSTRVLAVDLVVSRSTVVMAYDQLRAEGYLTSRLGAGTRVAQHVPIPFPSRAAAPRNARLTEPCAPRAFRIGSPALDSFPIARWTRAVNASLRAMPARQLSYGATFGLPALREAVAEYLAATRGVRCTADQIMIVNGSQQSLFLCSQVLVDRGASVWLEDPCYAGARGVFELAHARIVAVGVDDQGLIVAEGRVKAPDARVAFVTPSRQLPLGVTMSLARRLELIDWARDANARIIEDDYESEFRCSPHSVTALHGLDRDGSVIYTGSFSNVMFPALRLGYMVIPDELHDAFRTVRHFADMHTSYLEQAAMARFIRDGDFERHVRRLRTVYLERQHLLVRAARQHLGDRVAVRTSSAGLSLVAWLRPHDDDVAIARAICAAGIDVLPVSTLSVEHRVAPGLLLGFSGVRPAEIRDGVATLAAAIERFDLNGTSA